MSKILLVEDNPKYAGAASKYLRSTGNSVTLATDYSEAMSKLRNPKFDGVIIDCFFPETAGSGKIELGKELVRKICKYGSLESKMIESFGEYVDLEDPEMRKYVLSFVKSEVNEASSNPIIAALKRSSSVLGKEATTTIAKNSLRLFYNERSAPVDYYTSLMKAMEESEANQPLGVLVAEKADELDLPLILATSTYHHDVLTQPVHDYAIDKKWRLVDCNEGEEHSKASPEFWQRACNELYKKLRLSM